MIGISLVRIPLNSNSTEPQLRGIVNPHQTRVGIRLVVVIRLAPIQHRQFPESGISATARREVELVLVLELLGVAACTGFGSGFVVFGVDFGLGDVAEYGAVVELAFCADVVLYTFSWVSWF